MTHAASHKPAQVGNRGETGAHAVPLARRELGIFSPSVRRPMTVRESRRYAPPMCAAFACRHPCRTVARREQPGSARRVAYRSSLQLRRELLLESRAGRNTRLDGRRAPWPRLAKRGLQLGAPGRLASSRAPVPSRRAGASGRHDHDRRPRRAPASRATSNLLSLFPLNHEEGRGDKKNKKGKNKTPIITQRGMLRRHCSHSQTVTAGTEERGSMHVPLWVSPHFLPRTCVRRAVTFAQ